MSIYPEIGTGKTWRIVTSEKKDKRSQGAFPSVNPSKGIISFPSVTSSLEERIHALVNAQFEVEDVFGGEAQVGVEEAIKQIVNLLSTFLWVEGTLESKSLRRIDEMKAILTPSVIGVLNEESGGIMAPIIGVFFVTQDNTELVELVSALSPQFPKDQISDLYAKVLKVLSANKSYPTEKTRNDAVSILTKFIKLGGTNEIRKLVLTHGLKYFLGKEGFTGKYTAEEPSCGDSSAVPSGESEEESKELETNIIETIKMLSKHSTKSSNAKTKREFPSSFEDMPPDEGTFGFLTVVDHTLHSVPSLQKSIAARKAKTFSDTGSVPTRFERYPTMQLFKGVGKTKFIQGGTILVDLSGSMSLTQEQILSVVLCAPYCLIAGYFGQDDAGELHILARNGRVIDISVLDRRSSGNIVDGPAVEWLIQQRSPRFMVSDQKFTGRHEKWPNVASTRLIRKRLRDGQVICISTTKRMVSVMQGKIPLSSAQDKSDHMLHI